MQILLVENHDGTAQAVALLLDSWGHDATVVARAAEARAACDREHFDLLICDLGLPDQSGLDLMRGLTGKCGIPGIALSGYGRPEDVRASLEAGFAEHLTKPPRVDELRAAVRRVTRPPGAASSLR